MRIDFHHSPQRTSEPERKGPQSAAREGRVPEAIAEDRAQISAGHVQAQALAAQAAQLPEIRAERIQALRESIASGQYRFEPHKAAGAILSHMLVQAAR